MPITSVHPDYEAREREWESIRDALEGHRLVQSKGARYLPVPPGMEESTPNEFLQSGKRVGSSRYGFYLTFAEFPEIIAPVLNGFQGIIHHAQPRIELPAKMQYLLEDATADGDSLITVWRRVMREVLAMGRVAALSDISPVDDLVRFSLYSVENTPNWRVQKEMDNNSDLSFIVLREISMEPKDDDPFKLEEVIRYRELRMINGRYTMSLWEGENQTYDRTEGPRVVTRFGQTFDRIPISIINPVTNGLDFESPPMLPLVRRAYAIYRLSADYRRALYIKGDPQIFISGITEDQAPTKIGGDAIWTFPNPQAKAAYLDIDGKGIPLMKEAIDDEYERFYQEGGKLLDASERGAESGEALRRRQAAQQVSLQDVTLNVGASFELALKRKAVMLGLDPKEVVFIPDTDFAEPRLMGRDLLDIMNAVMQGAPLSQESIHRLAQRGGLTKMTYPEERDSISAQPVELPDAVVEKEIDSPPLKDEDGDSE